ncbi:hypothetical protein V7S43_010542 [Phytophthora oleae]|uniref:Uncharacterized protein n=1 Tax=Phytophthora oleae TaxID=2107226 RepID=A0ABD3FBV2_9STRA
MASDEASSYAIEDQFDNSFTIALIVSCREGQIDAVRDLIDYGVPVNLQDQAGNSPLSYAATNGHVEIVILLIDRGALVDLEDINAWTPLMSASGLGFEDVVVSLLRN